MNLYDWVNNLTLTLKIGLGYMSFLDQTIYFEFINLLNSKFSIAIAIAISLLQENSTPPALIIERLPYHKDDQLLLSN